MPKKLKVLKNIYNNHRQYKKGALSPSSLPLALWIEPTNACNLKCIMCPTATKQPEPIGRMDFDLYKKIIDEAKDFVAVICLCISGEPLLHNKLPQMIDYARKAGIKTTLSTNATLLTPEVSKEVLEADLDAIYFSFDGCSAEVYEKVRVGADFEKTLNNILRFLELKKELKKKTITELQILIMNKEGRENYEENEQAFKERFKGLPLNLMQTREPSTWGSNLAETAKFDYKKLGNNYSPCSYLWSGMFVLWDGSTVACCSDFYGENILGKFPEQSLKEIWNNKKYQIFRESMLEKTYMKHFKTCNDCDSLWSETIIGLPPGIRGILALSLGSLIGLDKVGYLKKIAGKLNPEFAIKSVEKVENNDKD